MEFDWRVNSVMASALSDVITIIGNPESPFVRSAKDDLCEYGFGRFRCFGDVYDQLARFEENGHESISWNESTWISDVIQFYCHIGEACVREIDVVKSWLVLFSFPFPLSSYVGLYADTFPRDDHVRFEIKQSMHLIPMNRSLLKDQPFEGV